MTTDQDILYNLLPAIYRRRDKAQGEPLRALMAIMEQELHQMEKDIEQSYANCFVETCQLTLLPFIADLLGIPDLHNQLTILPSQRRRIANTIRYRRHKGQASIIEQLVRDVTHWSAKLTEYFKLLGITQHIKALRPGQGATALVRDINGMDSLGTAFEKNAHTIEVRNPAKKPRFNIGNIGLFLWRLQAYPIRAGYAKKVPDHIGCYTFNSLGADSQLFNNSRLAGDLTAIINENDLPTPIRLAALRVDLDTYRKNYQALAEELRPGNSLYYGPEASIKITKVLQEQPELITQLVAPSHIIAANLSNWVLPHASELPAEAVFIDPALGRIALHPDAVEPLRVEVDYYYGFSGDIGGGHYNRISTLAPATTDTYFIRVSKKPGVGDATTIKQALDLWLNPSIPTDPLAARLKCVIEIMDDATYEESAGELATELNLMIDDENKLDLTIQAADDCRPCIKIQNNQPLLISSNFNGGLQVTLNGLFYEGRLLVSGNVQLFIKHCTLVPRLPYAIAFGVPPSSQLSQDELESSQLQVVIDKSILGAIFLPPEIFKLTVRDSIIDGSGEIAIGGEQTDVMIPGPRTELERVTVFGMVNVAELLLASECIITNQVITERTQTGSVRYSYMPLDSKTPPRYRCQPELDYNQLAQQFLDRNGDGVPERTIDELTTFERNMILVKLLPDFTSKVYGEPGYAQLSERCSQAIRTGAEDGSEMGAFRSLQQPQLEAQLGKITEEYLPYTSEQVIVEYST